MAVADVPVGQQIARSLFAANDGAITRYVVGLLFRQRGNEVALITKKRPSAQAGRLNGIGGKVERGETPLAAMKREFREEAGAEIDSWRPFCCVKGGSGTYEVHFFVSHEKQAEIHTAGDEEVRWYSLAELNELRFVANLAWIIPLALDENGVMVSAVDPTG